MSYPGIPCTRCQGLFWRWQHQHATVLDHAAHRDALGACSSYMQYMVQLITLIITYPEGKPLRVLQYGQPPDLDLGEGEREELGADGEADNRPAVGVGHVQRVQAALDLVQAVVQPVADGRQPPVVRQRRPRRRLRAHEHKRGLEPQDSHLGTQCDFDCALHTAS